MSSSPPTPPPSPPALSAARSRDRGIKFDGPTQFATAPVHGTKVGDLPSPPLGAMLSVMNRESINHFAELIFRDAARNAAPDSIGSAESGNALLQRFLVGKVGVDSAAVIATDGSGLSTLDRVTPRSLVQLLAFSHRTQWSDAFHASLPVAGETELLAHRMRETPAQGNLHAKTGTTNTVISLGGYVTAQDGELLAFAFIYNGWDRGNCEGDDRRDGRYTGFVRARIDLVPRSACVVRPRCDKGSRGSGALRSYHDRWPIGAAA